jgi:hypothetical protein
MTSTLGALALLSILAARAPAAPSAALRPEASPPTSQRASEKARARVVAAARRHVGAPFRGDCSGLVRRVYAEAGVTLVPAPGARSGTEAIVRRLARPPRPRRGDLAYFHRTHDRDPPGRGRNLFTHVAIVESVDGPRVTLVHRSSTGVERLKMNLARPGDPGSNGALRRRKAGDPPTQRYLASQLLAGFASPFRDVRARPPVVARAQRR